MKLSVKYHTDKTVVLTKEEIVKYTDILIFTFKFPSLLKFDVARNSDKPFLHNGDVLICYKNTTCTARQRRRLYAIRNEPLQDREKCGVTTSEAAGDGSF